MSDKVTVDTNKVTELVNNANAQVELKKQVSKLKQDELDRLRRENDILNDEAALAESKGKGVYQRDKDGNPTTYWDLVKQKIKEFSDPGGQMSYIEWQTAMADFFQLCTYLAKAMHYDNTITDTIKYAWNNTVGQIPTGIQGKKVGEVLESIGASVAESPRMGMRKLLSLFGKEGPLPDKISYEVDLDKNGKITSRLLADGKEFPAPQTPDDPDMKMNFDIAMVAWLKSVHNCDFDPATQVITQNGAPLTPDKIQELRQDDANGLGVFLRNREALDVEASFTAPRP